MLAVPSWRPILALPALVAVALVVACSGTGSAVFSDDTATTDTEPVDAEPTDTAPTDADPDSADAADADAPDHDPRDAEPDDTGDEDAGTAEADVPDAPPVHAATEAALDAFFAAHGSRDAFDPVYVDLVSSMLRIEDLVAAEDFDRARAELDRVFGAYPLSNDVWWSGVNAHGTNVGTPVAYYGMRMLDEIARVGQTDPAPPVGTLTLAVVMAACSEGLRPADREGTPPGEPVSLTIDPRLAADDHRALRQSLSLFRQYVWAITDGRLTLDVVFETVDACAAVRFEGAVNGITNANNTIVEASDALHEVADMWMVLYPSNVPPGDEFAGVEYITGGMGLYGRGQPVFIADDLWILRKPPHLGVGDYSDVERRVYLPQWYQHEFFHHLYRLYPDFGLEAEGHQWFDRSTWPDDFVGRWEPDYYAESLAHRLRDADPPLHVTLRTAGPTSDVLDRLTEDDVLGTWQRRPVENDWHRVTTERDGDGLWWRNAAGVRWSLTLADGVLRAGDDCPYGAQDLGIELARDDEGRFTTEVTALFFGGERYSAP